MSKPTKMLTKDDIRLIIRSWESKSVKEIAAEIGCVPDRIYQVAKVLRENGIHVPRKMRKGYLDGLIKEVASEGV